MIDFIIDENKCITCGLCAQDCPVGIINMNPKPGIRKSREKLCLKCQHCLAICPTAAISILGKKPENSLPADGERPTYEGMTRLIKTRRSIRKYLHEDLDQNLIQELLETTAYAPTGHNYNSVHFTLIDNKEDLDLFRDKIYAAIKKAGEAKTLLPQFEFLYAIQKVWENNQVDVIFRDAPHLLIASAPKKNSSPLPDCLIALSYFELLANSHDIGTLWNGMLTWVLNDIDPDIAEQIGIPKDYTVGYGMVFGKSAVKYPRAIQSEGLSLNRVNLTKK
ncbi:4Fe-4S dicluster domain-containing protein [Ancylomarina salipaludis]|uniref:4Fe-4S dicluster domain-containing protein n=1 Tax=Ancylomarina salipaludis TaxID=2501299 RepID=A0A4Q1JI05_9BACT|nr:nitroreductase family protein [Ancylomarina salipaludis]RXQ88058.1 4Fe-4S dicluster domain-containing protein [Ancylomarina salipaludis]